MGESRRRKQASEHIKQISVDTKEKDKDVTRGVTFPDYAEKYLGRELVEAIQIMGEELGEYETLVTEHNIPIHELVEYLGMVDFFRDYPPFVLEQAQNLSSKMLTMASTLIYKETYEMKKAHDKIVQSVQTSMREASAGRPILAAVCQGILSLMAVVETEMELTRVGSVKYSPSVATRDPLYLEKDFLHTNLRAMNDDKYRDNFYVEFPFLFTKQMSILDQKTQIQDKDTVAVEHTHELKKKIQQTELVCGRYSIHTLPSYPWIREIEIHKKESDSQLQWGYVSFVWEEDYSKSSLHKTTVSISYFTGDLVMSRGAFSSLSDIFHFYGDDAGYTKFTSVLYEAILQGMADGSVKVKSEEDKQNDKLAAKKSKMAQEDSVKIAKITQSIQEQKDPEIGVESLSTVTDESVEEVAVKNKDVQFVRPDKKAVIRNLSYEKAVRAFERLGFTIESGGRHHKLVRVEDGKRVTMPFMNPHTGATSDVSYIVKKTLRLLGISPDEFMAQVF